MSPRNEGGGADAPSPVPILLYHAIADDTVGPSAPWVISPREFAEHLDALAATGCQPVTVSRLVAEMSSPDPRPAPGTIAITFDDGFADFATGALPALAERGWPATLYVTTGALGATATWMGADPRPMLRWEDLAEVAAAGIEVGAHTEHHPQLDVVAPTEARREIEASKARLEAGLQRPVDTFAYPHGYHDRRVRQFVVDAGFRSACGVKHAFSSTADDRFSLSRVMVRHGDDAETVARWAAGEGLSVAAGGPPQLRVAAWRQVRRARARVGRAA